MSWPVVIRRNAEADLNEARLWYETQRPGLGDQLLDEVGNAIRQLVVNPERRPVYYNGFRRLLLRRFPYKLFYRIESSRVIVFRVLHVKRDHRRHL